MDTSNHTANRACNDGRFPKRGPFGGAQVMIPPGILYHNYVLQRVAPGAPNRHDIIVPLSQ